MKKLICMMFLLMTTTGYGMKLPKNVKKTKWLKKEKITIPTIKTGIKKTTKIQNLKTTPKSLFNLKPFTQKRYFSEDIDMSSTPEDAHTSSNFDAKTTKSLFDIAEQALNKKESGNAAIAQNAKMEKVDEKQKAEKLLKYIEKADLHYTLNAYKQLKKIDNADLENQLPTTVATNHMTDGIERESLINNLKTLSFNNDSYFIRHSKNIPYFDGKTVEEINNEKIRFFITRFLSMNPLHDQLLKMIEHSEIIALFTKTDCYKTLIKSIQKHCPQKEMRAAYNKAALRNYKDILRDGTYDIKTDTFCFKDGNCRSNPYASRYMKELFKYVTYEDNDFIFYSIYLDALFSYRTLEIGQKRSKKANIEFMKKQELMENKKVATEQNRLKQVVPPKKKFIEQPILNEPNKPKEQPLPNTPPQPKIEVTVPSKNISWWMRTKKNIWERIKKMLWGQHIQSAIE